MTDFEHSHALPAYAYKDPALVVENNQLKDLGCKACKHHAMTLGRVACTESKVPFAILKRVPGVGRNCKYFELKD